MRKLKTDKGTKQVGVFKTDVDDRHTAKAILETIRRQLPGSTPSFDLEDRDRVLRVESAKAAIKKPVIKEILRGYGHEMEVLP